MAENKDLNSEEHHEPVVNDRRRFNVDGSLREGVTITPEKPKEEPSADTETVAAVEEKPETAPSTAAVVEDESDEDTYEAADIPGADDPASFVNFLTTLASQAAAALGAMPHPATGQRTVDLETGKYWIEVLAMLKEKTKNNLHPKEQELFNGILGDLQMQYVQIQRMAEERLKQQAAQKFSAQDFWARNKKW